MAYVGLNWFIIGGCGHNIGHIGGIGAEVMSRAEKRKPYPPSPCNFRGRKGADKMLKERFIGDRRFELFKRDPLAQEMENLFRKSHSKTYPEKEKEKFHRRIEELWIELMQKWNCHISTKNNYSSKPFSWLEFSSGAFTITDATEYIRKLSAKIKIDLETGKQTRNHFERTGWIFYYLEGGHDDRGNIYIPIPPKALPIFLDIGGISEKDKTKVTEAVWNIVKTEIKKRKTDMKGQYRGCPAVRDPKELGFISNVTDDVFSKYLKWYDLYITGLPFRTIAAHEILDRECPSRAEEGKRKIADNTKTIKTRCGKSKTMRGVVAMSVKGEDNVEKGIKLVYEAIHRKPYPSKKKQTSYDCPEHGNNCPKECGYLKKWFRNFNKRKMLFKPLCTTQQIEDFSGDI